MPYSCEKVPHWAKHLTSLSKKEVGALLSVLRLTTKEHPCILTATHCPQSIDNGATVTILGSSSSDSMQHSE